MKVSTPKSRQDLHIKRRDRVLEVGPGNRPSFRANVLVEKFLGDDTHRCGGLRIFPHQQLVNAAAEALPFADKEFDYVICKSCHASSERFYRRIRQGSWRNTGAIVLIKPDDPVIPVHTGIIAN